MAESFKSADLKVLLDAMEVGVNCTAEEKATMAARYSSALTAEAAVSEATTGKQLLTE